jgi:hypothetical protein
MTGVIHTLLYDNNTNILDENTNAMMNDVKTLPQSSKYVHLEQDRNR